MRTNYYLLFIITIFALQVFGQTIDKSKNYFLSLERVSRGDFLSENKYIYDSDHSKLIKQECYSDLHLKSYVDFNYDDNDMIISAVKYYLFEEIDGFREDEKTEYLYNAKGKISVLKVNHWENGDWSEYRKYQFTYTENGDLESIDWIQKGVDLFIDSYTYDESHNLLKKIRQDPSGGDILRKTYSYNSQGKHTGYLMEKYSDNKWIKSHRYELTRDTLGNITQKITYNYNPSSNLWVENFKFVYEYYTEIPYSQTYQLRKVYDYIQELNPYTSTNFLKSKQSYSIDSGGWVPQKKYEYEVFSDGLSALDKKLDKSEVVIYPNPVLDYFRILQKLDFPSIEIFNENFKKIKSYSFDNQYFFDVKTLNSGIYFLRLQTENTNRIIKFIKK